MRKISLNKKDKSINPKLKKILIILVCVILALGLAVFLFLQNYHVYEKNVVKPDCDSKGYTESVCIFCKEIQRTHYTAALGHIYSEAKLRKEPTEIEFGENYQECSRCKKEKVIKTEPTIDFKKFYFTGDAFTVNADMVATGSMTYSYKGKKVTYYVNLGYVDNDKSRYIKHDYIVSFFADKNYTKPVEIALMSGKSAAHSWRLYGNHYDFNNVRDAVVSDLFYEVRKGRTKFIDKRIKSNYLVQKQEPVLFFMNTSFVGVFRLIEMEGAQTLNVKPTDKNCAIVRAGYSSNQSYFRTEIDEHGAFQVKYNSNGEDNEWIYESLNNLSTFVSTKEGEEFKKGISNYLDVEAMIDYMLVVYSTAAADNAGRALTLATYNGKVWTPTIFDADASFGLNNRGETSLLETILAPYFKEVEGETVLYPDTNSLLFKKMFECFYSEIKARYNQLKNTVFTAENINKKFENHINKVPQFVYDKEKEKYPAIESDINSKQFLYQFMSVRKDNLNRFFATENPFEKQKQPTTKITTKKETTN